jgi:hypothetical protein
MSASLSATLASSTPRLSPLELNGLDAPDDESDDAGLKGSSSTKLAGNQPVWSFAVPCHQPDSSYIGRDVSGERKREKEGEREREKVEGAP